MEDKYEVGVAEDGSYAYVRVWSEPITQPFALELCRRLFATAEEHKLSAYLVDFRGTRSVTSEGEKYNFAYHLADGLHMPRAADFALLKDAGDRSFDFLELVLSNAGFRFRLFELQADALAWLAESGA